MGTALLAMCFCAVSLLLALFMSLSPISEKAKIRLHITTIEVAAGVDTGMGNKATQDWATILSQGARKELWQL